MRVDFEWNKPVSQIAKDIINSDVQLFMANECKRQMMPYVPAQNLVLAQNVSLYVEDNMGVVEYRSPYAHYQWKENCMCPLLPEAPGPQKASIKSLPGNRCNSPTSAILLQPPIGRKPCGRQREMP